MKRLCLPLICLLVMATVSPGQEMKFDVMKVPAVVPTPDAVGAEPVLQFDLLRTAPPTIPEQTLEYTSKLTQFKFDVLCLPKKGKVADPPQEFYTADEVQPTITVTVPSTKCVVCDRLKRDVSKDDMFKFEFKVDKTNKEQSYPILEWRDGTGVQRILRGWKGMEWFEQTWDATERKAFETRQTAPPPPKEQSGYPTRTGWWTHPGSSRQHLIDHLLQDGVHRGKFTYQQLASMTTAQLESLHSDDHERRVQWSRLGARKEVPISGLRERPVIATVGSFPGVRSGSFQASVANRAIQIFASNVQRPPAQLVASANGPKNSREVRASKKGYESGRKTNGNGFASS